MTSTMASPISFGRSDWKPGHVPQLSYRNPLPSGETLHEREPTADNTPTRSPAGKGLSIKEIRESIPRDALIASNQTSFQYSAMQEQRPKKSFLGGLFTKEPSMAALDQVAQQMMAQHGSISPKSIPHVSSRKMPEHVPKVNSKWDGVPDYVKRKEKEEREQARTGYRNSIQPIHTRSLSTEMTDDQSVIRRRNSNAASTAESWDSRSTGSRPVFQDNYSAWPESAHSTSSNTSVHIAPRSPSAYPTTSITFTAANPSDIPTWIESTPMPPRGPQRMLSAQSTSTRSTISDRSRLDRSPRETIPSAESIPEYFSSKATTPIERSPQASSQSLEKKKESRLSISKASAPPTSILPIRNEKQSLHRSASTSKPANLVRQTSRGLGLHSDVAIAPWETQALPIEAIKPTQTHSSSKSRVKGRLFGKDKK